MGTTVDKKIKTIQELDDESKRWKILGAWKVKPAKVASLLVDNQKYFSAKDKANIFAKTLENKFTEHPVHPIYSCQNEVNNFQIPAIDKHPDPNPRYCLQRY